MNNFATEKKTVPIDSVMPNPFNPNFMDKATFAKEKASIKELGMLGSIIVRRHIVPEHYEILDGEHRWKAAKELGYTEMTVEVITRDVPDQEMKLLTILLNNLRGKDDIFKRAAILKELSEGQTQLLPWSAEEVENEKKLVSFNFDQYNAESDLPERTPGMLIVLPLNAEESEVWQAAKAELVSRKLITTDDAQKKQSIQMVMWMINMTLGITGRLAPVETPADKIAELEAIADSYIKPKPEEFQSTVQNVSEEIDRDIDYPGS